MKNADPCGMSDCVRAANCVKLLQQRCDMILGRVSRNPEPARDQLVRRAFCQQRKYLQFAGCELDIGFQRGRRSRCGDDKDVRFVGFADQFDPFDVGQNGRDPIGGSRVSHIDRYQ